MVERIKVTANQATAKTPMLLVWPDIRKLKYTMEFGNDPKTPEFTFEVPDLKTRKELEWILKSHGYKTQVL